MENPVLDAMNKAVAGIKEPVPEKEAPSNGDSKILESFAINMNKQTELLEKMAEKATPASSGTAVELHGDGSLFGSHTIERDVITAHIRPTGLAPRLPQIPTVFVNPFFASITGFTGDTGSEPAEPCDDGPYNFMKGCDLTAQFGRVHRDTKTVEINDVMLRKNRGDFTDLLLHGKLLGESGLRLPI